MYALLVPFVLALSLTAAPGQSAPAQQPPAKKAKKVWTNDDLDALRGGSRPAGGVAASTGTEPTAEGKTGAKEKQLPRDKDPKEYREKLAPLRAQLASLDAQVKQVRDALTNPYNGTNAVDLRHTSAIMRPEEVLKQLEQKRQEIQQQIDNLEEQARRNGLSGGDVR